MANGRRPRRVGFQQNTALDALERALGIAQGIGSTISQNRAQKAKAELELDIKEMTAMLDSYVSFVKTESPEPIENIIINEVIKDCIKDFNTKNYQIKFEEIDIVKTSGRPIQLKRAFQNIVDNSKRYADIIRIIIFLNEEGCNIEINDNGKGIPKEKYEDVFKPFYTLDPSRNKLKGESGLGLTITRDIIRSHGGEIKLDKSELGGLKLSVLLPI